VAELEDAKLMSG